jgi:hypothetical protein
LTVSLVCTRGLLEPKGVLSAGRNKLGRDKLNTGWLAAAQKKRRFSLWGRGLEEFIGKPPVAGCQLSAIS